MECHIGQNLLCHKGMTWTDAQLTPWLAAIRAGQPAAAPAEGVYGYVADPFNPAALHNLLTQKQRDAAKGFILLVKDATQLAQLCPELPAACQNAIAQYWQPDQPPTTLILPARPTLSPLLTGTHGTVAVRYPHPAYMQHYLAAIGQPLVSTSLNRSGEPAATSAAQIPQGIPALTLPEDLSGTPSRIFNPLTGQWLR